MAKGPAPNNRARVPHSIALWAVEWGNHLDARGCPVQALLGRGFSFAVAMSEGNDKCRDLGARQRPPANDGILRYTPPRWSPPTCGATRLRRSSSGSPTDFSITWHWPRSSSLTLRSDIRNQSRLSLWTFV